MTFHYEVWYLHKKTCNASSKSQLLIASNFKLLYHGIILCLQNAKVRIDACKVYLRRNQCLIYSNNILWYFHIIYTTMLVQNLIHIYIIVINVFVDINGIIKIRMLTIFKMSLLTLLYLRFECYEQSKRLSCWHNRFYANYFAI